MQVINEYLAFGLGQLGDKLSDMLVGKFAENELKVFKVFSDDLDFPDTDGTYFDKVS